MPAVFHVMLDIASVRRICRAKWPEGAEKGGLLVTRDGLDPPTVGGEYSAIYLEVFPKHSIILCNKKKRTMEHLVIFFGFVGNV